MAIERFHRSFGQSILAWSASSPFAALGFTHSALSLYWCCLCLGSLTDTILLVVYERVGCGCEHNAHDEGQA